MKKKSATKAFIRNLDQFGHEVNISHKGESHKTFTGGITTLLMCFLMVLLLGSSIDVMFSYGKTFINQTKTAANHSMIG